MKLGIVWIYWAKSNPKPSIKICTELEWRVFEVIFEISLVPIGR